jgi:hypothetical protein
MRKESGNGKGRRMEWLRHPIEAFWWWWREYDMPDWRSRIMRPYLRKRNDK